MDYRRILEIMDEIIEALSEVAATFGELAFMILDAGVKLFLIITCPIWIVPYLICKARKYNDRDDSGDDWDSYTSATR